MQVELTDWEKSQLGMHATGNALTYAGHFSKGGRWTLGELETGNKWRALGRKLSGEDPEKPWTPEDFPAADFRSSR
jgi:hypothetical protein